jgi:hypothetical protein
MPAAAQLQRAPQTTLVQRIKSARRLLERDVRLGVAIVRLDGITVIDDFAVVVKHGVSTQVAAVLESQAG